MRILAEPVQCSRCGEPVVARGNGSGMVEVEHGVCAMYTNGQIRYLGGGNWNHGLLRLMREVLSDCGTIGDRRWFHSELWPDYPSGGPIVGIRA